MRFLVAIFAITFCLAAFAQDECGYAANPGTEFQFKTEEASLQRYGYQLWSATTEENKALPYADYVGRKGKFIGSISTGGNGVLKFHDVLMENCEKIYLLALKSNLADESVERHGALLLTKFSRGWDAHERVDQMTDKKSCVVKPESELPFPLFVYSGAEVSVGVAGSDFPRKDIALRVDKLPAISEREYLTGSNAQRLVQQIRAGGKSLLVRSYKWPKDVPDTKEFSLEGIVPALDKCKAMLKR